MYTVFSGVQPTGSLHLGNYAGAIDNWLKLQEKYSCIFCIVDMHAITMPYDVKDFGDNVYKTLAAYMACGIDIEKNIVFRQSDVKEHTELAWLLSCVIQYGKLNGMIQFKEKAGKNKENVSLALYTYPVLMAADILLYKTKHVPVGEDQIQHVELTRDIASVFNHKYKIDYFQKPNVLLTNHGARIMSLKDGKKKMSKSDVSDYSRINLTDDADKIKEKISKAETDSENKISYDPENRAEISNLVNIYSVVSGLSYQEIESMFSGQGYSVFKKNLADLLVEKITPISKKMLDFLNDTNYLEGVLQKNANKARDIATQNIKEIKKIMGIMY